jgi:hypothetical protein
LILDGRVPLFRGQPVISFSTAFAELPTLLMAAFSSSTVTPKFLGPILDFVLFPKADAPAVLRPALGPIVCHGRYSLTLLTGTTIAEDERSSGAA